MKVYVLINNKMSLDEIIFLTGRNASSKFFDEVYITTSFLSADLRNISHMKRFNRRLTCELFTAIFSFKESLNEAAYLLVNRFSDFSAIDVLDIDWLKGTLIYRIDEDLCWGLTTGTQGSASFLTPFPNTILTIVSLGKVNAHQLNKSSHIITDLTLTTPRRSLSILCK